MHHKLFFLLIAFPAILVNNLFGQGSGTFHCGYSGYREITLDQAEEKFTYLIYTGLYDVFREKQRPLATYIWVKPPAPSPIIATGENDKHKNVLPFERDLVPGYCAFIFITPPGMKPVNAKSELDLQGIKLEKETGLPISGFREKNLHKYYSESVCAIAEYVATQPWCHPDRIFVIGEGLGARPAAEAAAKCSQIKGMIWLDAHPDGYFATLQMELKDRLVEGYHTEESFQYDSTKIEQLRMECDKPAQSDQLLRELAMKSGKKSPPPGMWLTDVIPPYLTCKAAEELGKPILPDTLLKIPKHLFICKEDGKVELEMKAYEKRMRRLNAFEMPPIFYFHGKKDNYWQSVYKQLVDFSYVR